MDWNTFTNRFFDTEKSINKISLLNRLNRKESKNNTNETVRDN